MKQKTRIFIYIAIAVTVLVSGILTVLSSSQGAAEKAQKFIDLGNKYLIELSYDKAVIEFNKAIEIEPKNADAYIGLAEAYIGLGDTDSAVDALKRGYDLTGDERIKEKLDELLGVDVNDEAEVTTEKTTEALETGTFIDEMIEISIPIAFFDSSDNEYGFMEHIYTDKGYEINVQSSQAEFCSIIYIVPDELPFEVNGESYGPVSIFVSKYNDSFFLNFHLDSDNNDWDNCANPEVTYYDEDGSIKTRAENEYDSENKLVKCTVYNSDNEAVRIKEYYYDENGLLSYITENDTLRCEYFYDNNGNKVKHIQYTPDGKENFNTEWQYDSNNNCISCIDNFDSSNQQEWKWEYDSSGNRIKETYTLTDTEYSIFSETMYESSGNKTEWISNDYHEKYEYDSDGRRVKEYRKSKYGNSEDEWDEVQTFRYNSNGELYEHVYEYSYGDKHTYRYNSNGELYEHVYEYSYGDK
ncbi:MAG: tetratricopeptide repeat protein, partial [Oscillospiraceae bacterium]